MTRHDLYTTVHKGIRAMLFDTARTLARTEFSRPEDAATAAAAVRSALALLDEHAEHEDAVIVPEVARLLPELGAALASDHARTDALHRGIAQLADRLDAVEDAADAPAAAERVAIGRRLHARFALLVAEHLQHLDREETEANRVLWAHKSDDELRAMEGRILASIPAPRLADWIALILPAASVSERGAVLGDLHRNVPPDVFATLTAPARAAMAPDAWHASVAAAGL